MAGRRPKPTNVRELEGNRSKRPLNKEEPQFELAAECPRHLKGHARAEWERLAPAVAGNRLLDEASYRLFEEYCLWFGRGRRLRADLDALLGSGEPGHGDKSYRLHNMIKTASEMTRKYAIELGFSPAQRAKMTGGGSVAAGSSDKLARFDAKYQRKKGA